MSTNPQELSKALGERTATVAVIGLGYVGLPLALGAAGAGFSVTGLDTDSHRVEQLREGRSPLLEVADRQVAEALAAGRLSVTADPACLASADVVIICVPTPFHGGAPDVTYIQRAAESVVGRLRKGQLVILESTTYPGTTEGMLRDILESTGLKAGSDFHLGFSPERIDPGNPTYHLDNVPKIIGGYDPTSAQLMQAFYGAFIEQVVPVSSPDAAEMAKLWENTYRHVNIALANEMAILCNDLGIDVWEVIEAASTKPFGFEAFYPGPGWGGHCIPVDPSYLSWRVRQLGFTARFVELAREFNNMMPTYVCQRITESLNQRNLSLKSSAILVLGVAYKPDVNDARESSAVPILDKLRKGGAEISYHDPYVRSLKVDGQTMASCDLSTEALSSADLVVLHTSHSSYDAKWVAANSKHIFDTRNFFKGVQGSIETL